MWHEKAYSQIAKLAEGTAPWAIAWPCVHEFLAIVTHPRILRPTNPAESPSLRIVGELQGHCAELRKILSAA